MALIQVKVIAGVFTTQQKEEIVERLTDAMVAIEGENMRRTVWCLVEEVTSGEWGIGGRTLSADDVKALAREHGRRMTTSMSRHVSSRSGAPPRQPASGACVERRTSANPHMLDPDRLPAHIDRLYRAGWALCGSRDDAEDLVQETLVNVLKRPRLLRDDNEIAYLMRALRNTYANRYRAAARRPQRANCLTTTRQQRTTRASRRAKSCELSQAHLRFIETQS